MVTFANVSLAGNKNLDSNEEAHIQNLSLDITRTPDNRSSLSACIRILPFGHLPLPDDQDFEQHHG